MAKSRSLSLMIIVLISFGVLFLGNTIMDSGYADIEDGTYEGISDAGIQPGLKVAVTVEDGKIVDVKVVSHEETEEISGAAIEIVPASIVEANDTVVDVVSGATYTSGAIMEATRFALESAK